MILSVWQSDAPSMPVWWFASRREITAKTRWVINFTDKSIHPVSSLPQSPSALSIPFRLLIDQTKTASPTYSSRGPTRGHYTDPAGVIHYDNLIKPDLVAPGNKIVSAESPGNKLIGENPALHVRGTNPNDGELLMSGTSVSTPVVAGSVALLLQRNPALTPNLVKAVLEYTSQPLAGFNNLEQGGAS